MSSIESDAPWRSVGLDRSEQHRLKRHAVLRAASRAFAQRGYFQTSLADIAKEFNLNKATLYHYFKSKDEILFEIHNQGVGAIIGDALVTDAASTANARERLIAFVNSYVTMLNDDFGACLVLTDLKPLEKAAYDQCVAGRRQVNELLREILRQGADDGSIARVEDPKTTSSFIFGALNWICHWYHADGEITPDELKRRAIEFVLNAVDRRPEPA